MLPNQNRVRFTEHIYQQEIPLLKESAIYGANGSGKSNFIKAVGFFKLFLTEKDFLQRVDLRRYKYSLIEKNDKPIQMEMEFTTKDKYYLYIVSINGGIREELYLSGIGKEEDTLVFRREGSRLESEYVENPTSAEKLLSMNTMSSVLPLNNQFPIFNNHDVNEVYLWLRDNVEVVDITSKIPTLIHLMAENARLQQFASELLRYCDLNISEFSVREQTSSHFVFRQLGVDGFEGEMDILSQSEGTVRLLTLIPAIYDALFNEKTVFVDEIENSMHPNLIFEMVKYYSSHRSNGQLIYTTHLTKLMDQQELLRLDEYWLTTKENGQTRMRSLSEYRIHNTINIEHGYLQGRYGAVPRVNLLQRHPA